MTEHHDVHHDVHHDHAPAARPTGIHRWLPPGRLRVLWVTPLFFGMGIALPVLIGWAAGWEPLWKVSVIVTVELVTVPFGFLVGLGGLDYLAPYVSGKPTVADEHSGHGAYSWRDYFRVNTDHKVIGIQYGVTTIIFFCIGG